MKMFFMTTDRERNLIRYSEKSNLKDAKPFTYEKARKMLLVSNPAYIMRADYFLNKVKENPFNDWIEY